MAVSSLDTPPPLTAEDVEAEAAEAIGAYRPEVPGRGKVLAVMGADVLTMAAASRRFVEDERRLGSWTLFAAAGLHFKGKFEELGIINNARRAAKANQADQPSRNPVARILGLR